MSDQKNQQQQGQQQQKKQDKGGGRPNQFPLYWELRQSFRFFVSLLKEGMLSAAFTLPIWAYFVAIGVTSVTIPTDFFTLWGIVLMMFLMQNNLFHSH